MRLRTEIERQNREQHGQAPDARVQEEFERRFDAPFVSPQPDDKVHRHQGYLEEHVEEQQIHRAEETEQACLHQQVESEILPRGALLFPGIQQGQEYQQGGEQDQRQGQAIDSEMIACTECWYPWNVLLELQRAAVPVKERS